MNNTKWTKIRDMGKMKFILKHGVLYWGVTVALLYFFLKLIVEPSDRILLSLIEALVEFSIGGFFVGLFTWNANEKRYQLKL